MSLSVFMFFFGFIASNFIYLIRDHFKSKKVFKKCKILQKEICSLSTENSIKNLKEIKTKMDAFQILKDFL